MTLEEFCGWVYAMKRDLKAFIETNDPESAKRAYDIRDRLNGELAALTGATGVERRPPAARLEALLTAPLADVLGPVLREQPRPGPAADPLLQCSRCLRIQPIFLWPMDRRDRRTGETRRRCGWCAQAGADVEPRAYRPTEPPKPAGPELAALLPADRKLLALALVSLLHISAPPQKVALSLATMEVARRAGIMAEFAAAIPECTGTPADDADLVKGGAP